MSFASARSLVLNSNSKEQLTASDEPVACTKSSFPTSTKGNTHTQSLRSEVFKTIQAILLALCFIASTICLHFQQWLGGPIYLLNRKCFYAWQAVVKESTALLLISLNQWIAPCSAKISGDASVRGQIRKTSSGWVHLDFPDRLVLIANHQIYTDWLFLWWSAYTTHHHGHLFIVLKDSLKNIPVLGPGMMFFSWVFLSRRWEADRPRFEHRMSHLSNPSLQQAMWLLIFPEGTNLSGNTRGMSEKWASKMNIHDLKHVLLPRTRGLQFCLEALNPTVKWVYDCTIAYEGIPPGEFGQDIYSLHNLYIKSHDAPVTHIHWRRFDVANIPLSDAKAFDQWLYKRWAEKDELLEHFQQHDCFPADEGYVEAQIKLNNSLEILQIMASALAVILVWWLVKTITQSFTAFPLLDM
ncbi:hypothetical protein AA0113_g6085 [Alternaria arborescens]|uniref:Phospholipid/glycerol acyltransferase domain-containing protein n=1 Tax=Alternaria arborescens TaxID=156630 RepID=A0A4Q4S106_9PLEO|nr:hypothetical protein AA0113_g6085 [Alternaria arborescens]